MNNIIETVEVGVDDAIPVLVAERRKRAIAGYPGIADHAIPCAKGADFLFQNLAALLAVAHVKGQ